MPRLGAIGAATGSRDINTVSTPGNMLSAITT
jgi:hypothetical protein